MSAGVSDQRMKGQGNQVINSTSKNVEKDDRFIPWSQQVDDAPYESVPSPTEGSQTGCYESSNSGGGTQFQYPPFKVKDGASWSSVSGNNSKSSRRLSSSNDNYDSDGTYGTSSHNNFQKNGDYYNSWSSQSQQSQQMNNASQNRKSNNHDEYYRSDRGNYQNDNVKAMQRGMQNMSIDGRNDDRSSNTTNKNAEREKSTGQTSAAPKQMTWASIASQPAKQPLRSSRFTSSSSTTLKKKGPGMPPPPMVPGKHNMDIGTWDSPKNGPQLVPPPPPPVIPVPIMEPPSNQNKNNPSLSNSRPSPQGSSGGGGGGGNSGNSHSTSTNNAPQNKQGSNNQPNRNYNQNMSSNSSNNNNNMRPSWADRDPPPHVAKNMQPAQNQRPSMHEGRSNSTSRQSSREEYSIHRNDHHHPPQSVSPLPPSQMNYPPQATSPTLSNASSNPAVLDELRDRNNYNPAELDLDTAANARFFVIKSYSEDDIHRSIKYGIWCSTEHGNKRLDQAFREREAENGCVLLFFSVNGSGYFCGMAHMMTPVDYNSVSSVWSQAKWKGTFKVRWIYVKDVPNLQLRHIRLENNENKPVTNSRDTQEVPNAKGIQVLKVLHSFKHVTSIFDDFFHYEKRQEEEDSKKYEPPAMRTSNSYDGGQSMSPPGKSQRGGSGDYDRGFDKGYSSGSGYRDKSYGRGGGFHNNYDNRRQYDEPRGGGNGFDRERDRDRERERERYPRDGPHYNNARGDNRDRENSGGEYNNRGGGFHRNDFRRDDRERGFNRDRDRDRDNFDDGFMSRSENNGRSGGFNRGDQYNRDRGDHNRGRGRIGQRN
ncbi:YTH domain-containing family protein isoform X1 [Hermetia illucens]|uniref:YTH domain-containing family protein isoform X1 n=1 Tax=Hermetia illucens TaxID=343691 RepID=UPI0018CC6C5C|nr:YTH domain-containing family protein isoform X1 [Hermetia illucens]